MKNNFTGHVTIPKEQLMAHENNPRKDIGDITELTQSIRKNGIMQNLTVMPADGNDEFDVKTDKFVILIGHRRFEAGRKAGVNEFPCNVVTGLSEREQLSIMLEENMQRTDLTILEQAQGFQMMLDLGETPESISKKTGFSKTTVRRRLNIAKLDKDIIRDKEDNSFQLTIMDFCELEKIKDVEMRNEILKNAANSDNLKWQIQRELENEKILKNKEKVIGILKKKGIMEAPEDVAGNIYRYDIERIGSIYLSVDGSPEVPEMDLTDGCCYYASGNCISVIRKKTREELKRENEDARAHAMSSNHGRLMAIENKMREERKSFIRSILDKELKEDVSDRLWKLMVSGKITVGLKPVICLLAGKEFAKIKEADRGEYKAKAESLDTVRQMLCIIEQEGRMSSVAWDNHYDAENAGKVIEFTNILEKFGFSYEDDDEYKLLLGTHELFAKDKYPADADTEVTEVSDAAGNSDIPMVPEVAGISGESDGTADADSAAA